MTTSRSAAGRFSGTNGPTNIAMTAGQTMTWYTDGSVIRGGFTICATTSRLLFPPPPPPSPSPPPPIARPPRRAVQLYVDRPLGQRIPPTTIGGRLRDG